MKKKKKKNPQDCKVERRMKEYCKNCKVRSRKKNKPKNRVYIERENFKLCRS